MKKTNEVVITIKKELFKFYNNKRLVFSTIILPGLVIAILYSVMGSMMEKQERDSQVIESSIYVINLPSDVEKMFSEFEIKYQIVDDLEVDNIKLKIKNKKEHLLIIFPKDFNNIEEKKSKKYPNIEIYYNASSTDSMNCYSFLLELLSSYEEQITNIFDINKDNKSYNLATEKESIARNISMILPTLLIGVIFSACMPISVESIAGEKEHGTIATLLVTPIKKSNLALGKIMSLSIIAMGGAISSYIGIVYSLPRLFNTNELFSVYGIKEYLFLLLTLLSVIMLLVSVMSLVSASAKSVKEASTFLTPFGAVVMILGMTCMIQEESVEQRWIYLLPIYNNILEIFNILSFNVEYINFIIMFVSNLIYTLICVLILSKMLKSEKLMFS